MEGHCLVPSNAFGRWMFRSWPGKSSYTPKSLNVDIRGWMSGRTEIQTFFRFVNPYKVLDDPFIIVLFKLTCFFSPLIFSNKVDVVSFIHL